MLRLLFILLISLAFSPAVAAKPAKTAKKTAAGGHRAYQRTLVFGADSLKSRPQVLLPADALSHVAIKAPLLTLEKNSGSDAEENTEAENTTVKESTIKIAPAQAKALK